MIQELVRWLTWVDSALVNKLMEIDGDKAGREEEIEGHDRLKGLIQRYVEPKTTVATTSTSTSSSSIDSSTNPTSSSPYASYTSRPDAFTDDLLPLPEGVLTHNKCGIPIVITCTKADRIDSTGDRMISKGLVSGKGYMSSSAREGGGGGGGGKGEGEGEEGGDLNWTWDERVDWVQQMLRTVALKCESVLQFFCKRTQSLLSPPPLFLVFPLSRAHKGWI